MASLNYCGVLGCEKSTTEGILFFPIPDLKTDKARRDKWIKILQLPLLLDDQDIIVCQLHFNKNQFTNQSRRTRLKRDAIPKPFLIEQEAKTDVDTASNILSKPTSEDPHEQDKGPQFIPTSILMKDLRVCIERLPNSSSSTSQVEAIEKTPLANVSISSKSIPRPGCALCKNQSALRSEQCGNFNETVGNIEDLKIFLRQILQLELGHFMNFPFCKKCTRRLEGLHTAYLELHAQQLKFERQIEELKKQFTNTFLNSHPTVYKRKKWPRSKCFQTITEQLESNATPVLNQIPIIKLPLSQQQKISTSALTNNNENQNNVDNICEQNMYELEYNNTYDSFEPIGGNDSDVDELEQKPENSSTEDLENERVEVQSSSTQIENSFQGNSFLSPFKPPAEECQSKTNIEKRDEKSSMVIGNAKKRSVELDDNIRILKKRKQNRGYRKPSTCPVCSAVRQGADALATHMLIHTGEKPHQCSDCGKAFAHLASFLRHRKHLHGYQRNNSAMDRDNYLENKNRLYNCDVCRHFKFYTKTQYLRHIKSRHANKEIMDGATLWFHYCDSHNCTISFSNPNNLTCHLLEDHHQNEPQVLNKCDVCLRVFCLKENLELHKTCHSSVDNAETVYPCSYCYMVFTTERILAQHIPRHKIEFNLSQFCHLCEMCGQGFLSMYNLSSHKVKCAKVDSLKKMSTQQKNPGHSQWKWPIITCEFCGKGIVSCHIKQHRFIHTHPEGFKCNICRKVSINPVELKRHQIKFHSNGSVNEAKNVCNFCQRSFSETRVLKMHMIKQHPEEYLQEKVHCISCLQLFDTQESMNTHFLENHPNRICPVNGCGKKCATTDALLRHRRGGVHLGNQNSNSEIKGNSDYWKVNSRLYNCDVCSHSKFYTKIRYLRHIKDNHVNQGINDETTNWFHYCDHHDCKKSFSCQKNLKNHFVEDHGQQYCDLNECDACLRVFGLKENLLVHKTTHSSLETYFPCSYCCIIFNTEEDLNDHTTEHKIEFSLSQYCHVCEFCGEGFKSLLNLRIHKTSKSGTLCRTPKLVEQTAKKEESPIKIKQARTKKKANLAHGKNKK